MPQSLPPLSLFALLALIALVLPVVIDQRYRKTRASILQWMDKKKTWTVSFDSKTIHRETASGYFRMEWALAEVIVTEGAILAFWYFPIFGHRWYSGLTHWHLNEKAIPAQIPISIPVESLKIVDGNLVVKSFDKGIDISTTFKGVTGSGQVELIRSMLRAPDVPYQEN